MGEAPVVPATNIDAEPNDGAGAPQTGKVATGLGYAIGFLYGTLGATDVDHYSLAVTANDSVSVACGALRTGSGLTATATGNLIFKVSGTQSATVTGNWYRCGIVVTTP